MFQPKDLFLFYDLPDRERNTICERLENPVSFRRGDVIYDPEHFEHALAVFLDGKGIAAAHNTAKAVFVPGDVFGAAALFGAGERYVSIITAKTACTVLFIREEMLREIFTKYPVCAVNYIMFLSDKVRYLNQKIAQYTAENATERLYRLLCDKADQTGRIISANCSLLASLSGMGRTSFYRALGELETTGLLCRDGKDFILKEKNL